MNPKILNQTSSSVPACTVFNGSLVMAYTGTNKFLNVMAAPNLDLQFSNLVTLDDASAFGPAVAARATSVCVAWKGLDKNGSINVLTSPDLKRFENKQTFPDSSLFGPSMTFWNDRFYLAWVGTDADQLINIRSSADGISWSGGEIVGQSSSAQVALAATGSALVLVWRGLDGRLNIMQSSNGKIWSAPRTIFSVAFDFTPAVAARGSSLTLAYAGQDAGHTLNSGVTELGSSGFRNATIHTGETTNSGAALVSFMDRCLMAWTGTDSSAHLNILDVT